VICIILSIIMSAWTHQVGHVGGDSACTVLVGMLLGKLSLGRLKRCECILTLILRM
jgi:hypothetical protein